MNLRETVLLQLKDLTNKNWFPTVALLEAPDSFLGAYGYFDWQGSSAMSVAKVVLWYLAADNYTVDALVDVLEKDALFMENIAKYETRVKISPNYERRNTVSFVMYQGLNWLKELGLCESPVVKYQFLYKIAPYGRSIMKVMRWHDSLLEALDVLVALNGEPKCVSAKEEKLACILAGHAEWMEKQWLEQQMKWLSAIFYLQNGPSQDPNYWLVLLKRVFAVKSWHDKMVACHDAEIAKLDKSTPGTSFRIFH